MKLSHTFLIISAVFFILSVSISITFIINGEALAALGWLNCGMFVVLAVVYRNIVVTVLTKYEELLNLLKKTNYES